MQKPYAQRAPCIKVGVIVCFQLVVSFLPDTKAVEFIYAGGFSECVIIVVSFFLLKVYCFLN